MERGGCGGFSAESWVDGPGEGGSEQCRETKAGGGRRRRQQLQRLTQPGRKCNIERKNCSERNKSGYDVGIIYLRLLGFCCLVIEIMGWGSQHLTNGEDSRRRSDFTDFTV